mgnify:CR=1 FL=1
MVKINLNDEVSFKLTDHGKKVYDEYAVKNAIPLLHSYPTKMDLHEFMRIFGSHMVLGFRPLIKDNNLGIVS